MAEESIVLTEYSRLSLALYESITVNLHMITLWGSVLSLGFCFAHVSSPIFITDSLYPGRQQFEEQ